MKYKNLILGFTLVTVSLLFAACGGGNSDSGEFSVTVGDDFMFDPSVLTVAAGQEITIAFTNEASVEHTFNILSAGGDLDLLLDGDEHDDEGEDGDDHEEDGDDHSDDGEEELHSQVLLEIHAVKPGDSATKTFTAPSEPGDYIIFCSLPGHADAGMVGTLTVSP